MSAPDVRDLLAETLYDECKRLIKLDPPPDGAAGRRLIKFLKALRRYDRNESLKDVPGALAWIRRAQDAVVIAA